MADGSEHLGVHRAAHSLLLHKQLLGRRLYIQSLVRFFVAASIVFGTLIAKHIVGVENLDVPSLMILAASLCFFNLGAFAAARRFQDLERAAANYRFLQGLMHITIVVDFVFLTICLWLVGGPKSPLQAFYMLHVILASILLSQRAAYAHAFMGYALFTALVLGDWFGVLPARMPVGLVNSDRPLDGRFILTVLSVQGFLMALTVWLVTGLTQLLREGEQKLREANVELERLSNLRRDFLHIALHDLKAPISAAAMLTQSLQQAVKPPLTESQAEWVDRIRHRLEEASDFVRDFEFLGTLETVDVAKDGKRIDLAKLLEHVVQENQDLAQMHNHTLRLEMADGLPAVFGIDRLIHEAVDNLITNAIKYTPDNGTICVRGRRAGAMACVEVQDNGIGIKPEDQAQLFHEFSRIRRANSAVGKVAGSGLGLSIVRRTVEAHGGRVRVTSRPNEGSTFTIELPAASDN